MNQPQLMLKADQCDYLIRRPAHMGQPAHWNGRVYNADEIIQGYEHATQTPFAGEEGDKIYHEWHYTHLTTQEGDIIMAGFVTKQLFAASIGPSSISPGIAIDCVMHDGTEIDTLTYYRHYRASRERLDIEIGDSWMRAEDDSADTIRLYVESGGIKLDVSMTRTVPAFRSSTGKTIFGDGTKWEAWDVIHPSAVMNGNLTISGAEHQIQGKAYVDHAYGNEFFGVNHWYWITADIGPYTFVASTNFTADQHMLTTNRDYLTAFMMAKSGKLIGTDPEKVQFVPGTKEYIPQMRRHISTEMKYRYTDKNDQYVLTLKQKNILRVKPLLSMVVKNRLISSIAQKFAIGGPYLRATYDAWLDVYGNGKLMEQYGPADYSGEIVGEIFYPGRDDTTEYQVSKFQSV